MQKLIGCLAIACWLAPVQAEPFFQSSLIFPMQDMHVHSSSIVQTPDGDFLACWFHGSGERTADDVLVQGARLEQGSAEWSEIFVMANSPGFPDCNPVLFIDANERLHLFWAGVQANAWQHSLLMHRYSDDYTGGGPPDWKWQEVIRLKPGDRFAERVDEGFNELESPRSMWAEYAHPYERLLREASRVKIKRQTGWMGRNQPIQLENGRIILPVYSDGFNFSLVAYSDDGGETWQASEPIVTYGGVQPALAQRENGDIVAFMRDNGDPPKRMQVAISGDDGETWTVGENTDVPNPGSSMEVAALDDGRWAMIHNDLESGRHRLVMALSEDEGRTWAHRRVLEDGAPGQTEYSYPALIQAADGRLHATYSFGEGGQKAIKHVEFDPDWILEE